MKIRAVLILMLLVGVGCVKVQPCPSEDLRFISTFDDGWRPIFLEKGYFDDRKVWFNEEQWKELIENFNIYLQEQRELEYERRFGE